MSKILQLTFLTQGGSEMQLSIPSPVDGITLPTLQKAVIDMIPALQSSSGDMVQSLKSAQYQTTTVEEITE